MCGAVSSEPITQQVKEIRRSATCTLDNQAVARIIPGNQNNPSNVRNVEKVLPEAAFEKIFPKRNSAYTYTNFLRAIGKYPAICASANICPKILAVMFAHFEQETAGLVYLEEINKSPYCGDWSEWIKESYPCKQGKLYYGRGAKQLSWNYNYGAFSNAMFGDPDVLLENPELVATSWLNFASSMWFFVTPQPPKPSMLQVIDGTWKPNKADSEANIKPGFGATIMIINGALECGTSPSNTNGANNRARYYKDYARMLGVDVTGENLLCPNMKSFSGSGSAGKVALYWGRDCSLVTWQTAYSALVEGDYDRCRGIQHTCSQQQSSPTTTAASSTSSTPVSSTSSTAVSSTSSTAVSSTTSSLSSSPVATSETICSDKSGLYSDLSSCSGYYQCSQGVPYHYSCPHPLLWNNKNKQCDWQEQVQCQGK